MSPLFILFTSVLSVVTSCKIAITDDKGTACMCCFNINWRLRELEKQIESLKNQTLHISMKELSGRKNIALKKTCGQKGDNSKTADRAADGDLDTFSHTTVTVLKDGTYYGTSYPYWWVDLGQNFRVKRIDIYNRLDCCGERLRDLEVTVGKTLDSMKFCASYKGPATNGELVILSCREPTEARYVKLMIMDENPKNTFLHPAEVEVYE